nr:zinc finger, CCHC-type [Tanacetum cinerariifolium]
MPEAGYIVVGFGASHDTCDPKLVKIYVDKLSSLWVVEVFTLSTCVWKTVYIGAPFKSCSLSWHHVFVDGVIYFHAYDDVSFDDGVRLNIVISFDLKSDKFGEVSLPERLVHTPDLNVTKVNESLGLLEYHEEGGMKVCGVWSRKDCANNLFIKIYTIKVEGISFDRVLGFRNTGEVVMELQDADNCDDSSIGVYEPLSGHIYDVGINGKRGSLSARSSRRQLNRYRKIPSKSSLLSIILRVGGCKVVVRIPDPKLKTLGKRGIECIFVGYAEHSKTFRFYVIEPNKSVLVNSIIESRDAIFDANRFSSVHRPSLRIPNGTEDIGGSVVLEEKEAINDEMDSIMSNNTWVLTNLHLGYKTLGCKRIFKIKLKVDGTIEKFKARQVIQGFRQKSGIAYFDTYASIARFSTIRLLIAMASIHNLIIHPVDVKTTFLNGELDDEGFNEVVLSSGYLLNHAVYSKFDETEFLSSKFSMKDIREADVILAAGKEVEWLRIQILKIPLLSKPIAHISILYDSAATLAKAYSQMYNVKSRHLGFMHNTIREHISNGGGIYRGFKVLTKLS